MVLRRAHARGTLWNAQVFPLLKLLSLDPAVLEPDFDLPLRQVDQLGELPAPRFGDVGGAGVLSLQLCDLELGIGSAPLA